VSVNPLSLLCDGPAARQRPGKHVLAPVNTRRIKRIVALVGFFAVRVAKKVKLSLCLEVSGQLHAPAAVPPRKEPSVPIG
jgi:hypothetical protein